MEENRRHAPETPDRKGQEQILAIKVGGSLFSDKSIEGSLDRAAIAEYAHVIANLFKSNRGRVVFISGGGAVGHGALRDINGSDPFGCLPLTKALADVRWAWTEALVGEGVRALPLQLGAMSALNGDGTFSVRADTVRDVLASGALPVLSGDSVLGSDGALYGLSSDRVPEFLMRALKVPLRVVSFTDVPGILLDGPNGKETLRYVDPGQPDEAYNALWAKSEWDTTGGFKTKLDALISCASSGAECFILQGSAHDAERRYLLSPYSQWPKDVHCTRIALPEPEAHQS
ncbi:amino acid kinase family protein [Streptosporangium sp. H16]|uniref:amino acid kinase family protein n=1 Tax=Streptosporangium sp. H16 TaxID=3444184 RepID=UPI003F78F5CC